MVFSIENNFITLIFFACVRLFVTNILFEFLQQLYAFNSISNKFFSNKILQ
jgi:hypothetical protein